MGEAESHLLTAFRAGFPRFAESFNAGDFERAGQTLAEDVEQRFPEEFPERRVRGREAWVRFFDEYRRDLETWSVTLLGCFDAGPGQLIVSLEYIGIGRASGLRQIFRTWDLIEFDDHTRIRLIVNCADRSDAERAAAEQAAPEGG